MKTSPETITAQYTTDDLKPLDYAKLNENPSAFQITKAEFFVSDVSKTGTTLNSFKVNGFVSYVNAINPAAQNISIERTYSFNRSSVAANRFEVHGQTASQNNVINIFDAVAASRQSVPPAVVNFLPSYIYRAASTKLNPTVNEVIAFYNRFVARSDGVISVPVVYADDENGTMRIDFILNQPVNGGNRYSFTYTGFKKYNDFAIGLKGQRVANGTYDFQTVPDLDSRLRTVSPYELATGYSLKQLFDSAATFGVGINPARKDELVKTYRQLNGSNVDRMDFTPQITNLDLKDKPTLLRALVTGTANFVVKYTGLTRDFADRLGLDRNFAKTLSFSNLPKIDAFFGFEPDPAKTAKLIDAYASDETLSPEFVAAVKQTFVVKGFELAKTRFALNWDNGVLNVDVTPQNNLFTDTLKILPSRYRFQLS